MNKTIVFFLMLVMPVFSVMAAGTVSGVKARQRYPWNGMVDIDCAVSGAAGTPYSLTVNARDKVGGTNLTVKTVNVEGESTTGNPVSVTSGVYRLVWHADTDLPNGFRGEKVSISVTVTDNAKKFMIVDLQTGAITYQAVAPEGGWDVDEYKGTKMAFVRIEPGTFTQYSVTNMPGRKVTITKPYYMGILPVTHKQLRTLVGSTYIHQTFNDSFVYFAPVSFSESGTGWNYSYTISCFGNAAGIYRGNNWFVRDGGEINWNLTWPSRGHEIVGASPLGVLMARSGLNKFDLPTEAQVEFARDQLVWSGYTMCLDVWNPWLGTVSIVDPQGDVGVQNIVKASSAYTSYQYNYATTPVCVGQQIYDRRAMSNTGISANSCPTRFCLFDAE